MSGTGSSVHVPRTIVVMGVSGSGKTTVGRAVAARIGRRFVDADDYHSAANVAKMAAGIGLDDADRRPWLASLNVALRTAEAHGEPVVLACSALKASYRRALFDGLEDPLLVYLAASPALIRERLAGRRGHFASGSLIDSQFAALEPPDPAEALVLDAARSVDDLATAIVEPRSG